MHESAAMMRCAAYVFSPPPLPNHLLYRTPLLPIANTAFLCPPHFAPDSTYDTAMQVVDMLQHELQTARAQISLLRDDQRVMWLEMAEKSRSFTTSVDRLVSANDSLSAENSVLRNALAHLTQPSASQDFIE
mmetsp:Transcript_42499/g.109266  ORF Transcript_42499/g.109266 Transcript_42499/m.109266 type:complete len:132 (-) Transcript_42499:115-510(-)